MKFRYIIIPLFLFILSACGTSTRITGSWVNEEQLADKDYNNVFIAALTGDRQLQSTLENELATRAELRGVNAITSHNTFTRTFTSDNKPSKEELLSTIKNTEADAIFTVTVQDVETDTHYVPGTSMYPTPVRYSYYGNFYGYYDTMFPITYNTGYYTEDKVYYMESNLYDAETEELLWSAQSKTYDPVDVEIFVEEYAEAIADQLADDGLIKEKSR